MGDLTYDWGLMTWKTKALFIGPVVALVIVLASQGLVCERGLNIKVSN